MGGSEKRSGNLPKVRNLREENPGRHAQVLAWPCLDQEGG